MIKKIIDFIFELMFLVLITWMWLIILILSEPLWIIYFSIMVLILIGSILFKD